VTRSGVGSGAWFGSVFIDLRIIEIKDFADGDPNTSEKKRQYDKHTWIPPSQLRMEQE
jgi:hypothetical protein